LFLVFPRTHEATPARHVSRIRQEQTLSRLPGVAILRFPAFPLNPSYRSPGCAARVKPRNKRLQLRAVRHASSRVLRSQRKRRKFPEEHFEELKMLRSLIACVAAALGLAGCVAVPYYEPAGPGYYYAPAAPAVSFGYSYHGGGHRHHHYRRHHRH
jgi:hypothetical protein